MLHLKEVRTSSFGQFIALIAPFQSVLLTAVPAPTAPLINLFCLLIGRPFGFTQFPLDHSIIVIVSSRRLLAAVPPTSTKNS
jgi:hypothetical protein